MHVIFVIAFAHVGVFQHEKNHQTAYLPLKRSWRYRKTIDILSNH